MKTIDSYKCEGCYSVYELEKDAISCEQSHRAQDVLSISSTKHRADFSRYGFPEKLILEITDYSGCLAEYEFVRECPVEEFLD